MKEKTPLHQMWNMISTMLILIFLVLGIRELYYFLTVETEYQMLREEVVQLPRRTAEEENTDPFLRNIDFGALQKINPDITGWLYIPDTGIDYPVLTGNHDESYLFRDYQGNYCEIGSVFTFAGADLNTNGHLCMFGHNLIAGHMFGTLKKYGNPDYASHHQKMYLYTPERTKECTLLSVFGCLSTDPVFELRYESDSAELSGLQAKLMERSTIQNAAKDHTIQKFEDDNSRGTTGQLPKNPGQIFTLATCDGYSGTPRRFTVHFMVTQERFVLND